MRAVPRWMAVTALGVLTALAGCAHHHAPPAISLTALNASPKTIDSLWTSALDLYRRHKWEKAAETFDRVELELPPGDRRALEGRLYLGDLYVRSGSNLQGVREYQRLVDDYPTDSLAPEALLRSGDAYAALWRNPELDPTYGITAKSVYSEVLSRYPGTPAATRANLAIAALDDKFATKEYREAKFYLKYKANESAILYLKDLVLTYPQATVVPDALADLVDAYRKLNYQDDIRDTCTYMRTNWATTPQYRKSCPAAAAPDSASGKAAGG